MRRILICACAAFFCGAAGATSITEDFESYDLGPLDAHTGPGGLTWQSADLGGAGSAHVARPGYFSAQSGRWEAEDVGAVSQGDNMFATFAATGPRIVVQAMSYAYLNVDTQYAGRRSARFEVSNDLVDGLGIGLEWSATGLIGDTHGTLSNVQIVNAAWVPIRIELDYAQNTFSLSYGGSFVTSGALLVRGGPNATVLNITLGTVPLELEPSPNDALLIDDIVITPEPASLVFALALLAVRRR